LWRGGAAAAAYAWVLEGRGERKGVCHCYSLAHLEYSFIPSLTHTPTHIHSILTQQDIAVVEAAKLEDIDLEEIPKIYAEAMKDYNAAPEGSKARVEAQIEVEVAKSLAGALGVVLV